MSTIKYDQAKEEILNRIDILDLVSEYVNLKKAGRNYKGICPFHPEKTPSFHVDKEKQLFYCFGCHAGGDAFTFLMKLEGLTFIEALERLAKRCGITLRKDREKNFEDKPSEKQKILAANLAAKSYFERRLWEKGEGLDYLKKRGLENDLIKEFGLGFAIDSWDALLSELKKSFPVQLLLKSGLICERQKGSGYYDRFRNRVIFPIHNLYGDICGFGGRLIEPSEQNPKYLNSPETPVYSKGQVLYGFYMAKKTIRQKNQVIIVEGYFDLITLFQAEFTNVVATLGTALTKNHIRLLKRYTNDVILMFDSDSAGLKAAERGIELFLEQGIMVKIAQLPSGRDPDSLIRNEGKGRFAQVIEEAKPFVDFLLNNQGALKGEVMSQEKTERIDQIIHFLVKIGNPLEQDAYIHYVSQKVNISEDAIRERLGQIKRPKNSNYVRPFVRPKEIFQSNNRDSAERLLIKLALELGAPSNLILKNVDESDFKDPELRALAGMIFQHWRLGNTIEPRFFLMEVDSENQKELVSQLIIGTDTFEDPEQAVQDCLKRLRHEKIKGQIKAINEKLDSEELPNDEENLLLNEIDRLKKDACTLNLSL